MRLFLTDLDMVAGLVERPGGHKPRDVLARTGVRALMPFVLDSDGSYDLRLNRYLRALPLMRVQSSNSWKEYASELVVWDRFLAERRRATLWDADADDVVAFHAARRGGAVHERISADTWNRSVSALSKFYEWAITEGHVERNPFVRRHRSRGRSYLYTEYGAADQELVTESSSPKPVKYLTVGAYVDFREVGLRGRLPDGAEDPSWRGRNGSRNGMFGEFLATTGLRLEEGAAVLLAELPPLPRSVDRRTVPLDLARSITKGGKPRRAYLRRAGFRGDRVCWVPDLQEEEIKR